MDYQSVDPVSYCQTSTRIAAVTALSVILLLLIIAQGGFFMRVLSTFMVPDAPGTVTPATAPHYVNMLTTACVLLLFIEATER